MILLDKAKVISLNTPNRYLLNGLWLGPEKAPRVIIHTHGLSSNLFSKIDLLNTLTDSKTAVIIYNNRGHEIISRLRKIDRRRQKGYRSELAGAGLEDFTQCRDDLQGVIDFAQREGADDIYLSGHSTGCQKSVYYLNQRGKQAQIAGLILICPLSDYAAAKKDFETELLEKVTHKARAMVKNGRGNELLPLDLWPLVQSASRFLSLFTPHSEEEIFTYSHQEKSPAAWAGIKTPCLVVLAEKDEYRDRPIDDIARWFKKETNSKNLTIKIINESLHGLQHHKAEAAQIIRGWLHSLNNDRTAN